MSGWTETTLGAVLELKRGYDLPTRERNDGPFPIVSSSGISGSHSEAKVQGPGVVTGRYGTLGQVFYIPGDFWPLNTSLYVRDFKANNPRFIASLLESMKLAQHDGAAAVPGLNRNQLHDIPVRVPDRATQDRIAFIMGSIDGLLEINKRRVAVLEEMVRAVYQEWFVHFRHSGSDGVALVDSPMGPIPQGWEAGTVSDVCSRIQAGGTPKRSEAEFWADGDVDWYKTGDLTDSVLLCSSEQISHEAIGASTARLFQPETILMAIYGSPTVGRLGLLQTASSANQAALGLTADIEKVSVEYLWFLLEALRGYLNKIAQGAAQQNVSKAKVAVAPALVPPFEIVQRFTEAVQPAWRGSHQLLRQNQVLMSTRDLLLPRLITGRIDVSCLDLESVLEGSAE